MVQVIKQVPYDAESDVVGAHFRIDTTFSINHDLDSETMSLVIESLADRMAETVRHGVLYRLRKWQGEGCKPSVPWDGF